MTTTITSLLKELGADLRTFVQDNEPELPLTADTFVTLLYEIHLGQDLPAIFPYLDDLGESDYRDEVMSILELRHAIADYATAS